MRFMLVSLKGHLMNERHSKKSMKAWITSLLALFADEILRFARIS